MSAAPPHRLGILLSGRGSNFRALAEAVEDGRIPEAAIAVVLSDREDAPGLASARERGIHAVAVPQNGRSRRERDGEMLEHLLAHGVTLVCLAGYMRLLSPEFIAGYPGAILNIHPSLLPAFPGLDAQRQALAYGVAVSGCTVHFVDEQLDHGVIVGQLPVPVLPDDNEATLSARILAEEHRLYPEAVRLVLSGQFQVTGRRLVSISQNLP